MQADLFTEPEDWLATLQALRKQNKLRELDIAVARFLHQQCPSASASELLLAAFTSYQHGNGHVCLHLDGRAISQQLWGKPEDLPAWFSDADAAWPERLAQGSGCFVSHTGQHPLVLDGTRLYLRRNWALESRVAEAVNERVVTPLPMDNAALARHIKALFPAQNQNPEPSHDEPIHWQKVACALASRSRLAIITGGPGTGKTTTVVRLLGLLQSMALENGAQNSASGNEQARTPRALRIHLAAPTGKAAARLTESIAAQIQTLPVSDAVRRTIPSDVTTLHRLLGTRPDSRHFRHHQHNPLHTDVVVVDEASMIDLDMVASLLDALPPQARLILLGDKDQLASVEAGAVMGDLCRHAHAGHYLPDTLDFIRTTCGDDLSAYALASQHQDDTGTQLAQYTAMLRTNWRSKDAPGISALANAVNDNDLGTLRRAFSQHTHLHRERLQPDQPAQLDALLYQGSQGHAGLKALFDAIDDAASNHGPNTSPVEYDQWAADLLRSLTGQQLLSGLRSGPYGVEALNQRITDYLHQQGRIPAQDWYAGRPVMMTRNDYQLGLMNGDIGLTLPMPIVTNSGNKPPEQTPLRVAFQLPDGSIKWVLPSRLESVETVYAMTVHKSQGSEFTHTLLVLPDHPHPLLTRELIYTAITRARSAFSLLEYGAPSVLENAVKTPTSRASGLAERLT